MQAAPSVPMLIIEGNNEAPPERGFVRPAQPPSVAVALGSAVYRGDEEIAIAGSLLPIGLRILPGNAPPLHEKGQQMPVIGVPRSAILYIEGGHYPVVSPRAGPPEP